MLFSYQWLKTYVPSIPEPNILKEELTRRSVEVESIADAYPLMRDIIVAEVRAVDRHPDADRLVVCNVYDGKNEIQVVCGGSNVRAGMRVALAPVGATVQWHGEGEPIVLEKAKIRGLESFGMICSTSEIGLAGIFPPHEREVFDLSGTQAAPGAPLAQALNMHDYIVDIDNKSMTHRPDLFSHRGLAREIAAVFNLEMHLAEVEDTIGNVPAMHSVVEDAEACRRYRLIELEVTVAQAPEIVRNRLQLCGIKSINNVVDITNYILLEYGQPVHAFDAEKVSGDMIVRRARTGEKIETLDHETHELTPDVLVIADTEKPRAIAGIIGGVDSAITESTKRVYLEVAHFDAVVTRKASQHVGVRTDGVLRWEKGPSEELPTYSAPATVELLKQYADAKVLRAIDVYPKKRVQQSVEVAQSAIARLVGISIPLEESAQMLTRLGCVVVTKKDGFTVTPPWFRMDLNIQEDVIEEVVRMYGIHRIPEQYLRGELRVAVVDPEVALQRRVREQLALMKYSELYSYSFYGDVQLKRYDIASEPHVEILNPLSDDLKYLRVSLLPNMLNTVVRNSVHEGVLNCFEIGHVYFADREVRQLAIVTTGSNAFRRLRGIVEQLLTTLTVPYHSSVVNQSLGQSSLCPFWQWYEGAQALEYRSGTEILGTIGELAAPVASRIKMKYECAFATLSIPQMVHDEAITKTIRIPSEFPALPLDLSLVVPESVAWGEVERVARVHGGVLLQNIELKDIYTGAPLEKGTKSFLFRLEFQAQDHTLAMNEMEEWRDQFVAECSKKFGAILRDNA
ncbi:MAG: phenylalanine--tRNA ligase subunit beta [Candidatus Kerfeldbacteria bacterium]|nr:phenylalanine--tRNA ligase subunit beta [Candidatus Kerfeldbacteria bacterium]